MGATSSARDLFFVGRSSRTNDLGIVSLRKLAGFFGHELRVIDIPDHALHLTSISSTPTDSIILAPEGYSNRKISVNFLKDAN